MGVANVSEADRRWQPWYYQLRRTMARWDLTPGQLTGIYLVLGLLALYFSDVLLVRMVEDPAALSQLQAVKGGLEVVLTGGLIFVLARRSRRSLRQKNERLERQREELQVLHRVLRHNLRNDVNLVHGNAASLAQVVDDPRHRTWCEEIMDVAERIVHYTEQTQKINRVTEDDATRAVDLAAVASRVVDNHPELTAAVSVELSVPETAIVRAHPLVEVALHELVTNAVRHNDSDDPMVALTIDSPGGPSHLTELVVADNGPGISDDVRRTVQHRGETQLGHLDGLGLWLVSWVVTLSNGQLSIEDRSPNGARVRIRLPRATTRGQPTSSPSVAGMAGG